MRHRSPSPAKNGVKGIEGDWTNVAGSLNQIDVGPLGVFGVNSKNAIVYRLGTRNNPSTPGTEWKTYDF